MYGPGIGRLFPAIPAGIHMGTVYNEEGKKTKANADILPQEYGMGFGHLQYAA